MMKRIGLLLIVSLLAVSTDAAELIPSVTVNGKVYRDVRWGPVNQGKVVMFHSRGNVVVPLSDLPSQYQALLGYQPPTSSPAPTTTPSPAIPPQVTVSVPSRTSPPRDLDWETYTQERKTAVVLNNKLVDRTTLASLVGFVGSPVRIYNSSGTVRGTTLEIAERRTDVPQPANELTLRPNLWQRTGKMVLLRDYKAEGEPGILVRVYVAPAEDLEGNETYAVAKEPSFELWKQLRSTTARFP